MNWEKHFKLLALGTLLMSIFMGAEIENLIDKSRANDAEYTATMSSYNDSINYLQEIKRQLHDEPLYGWPIHVDDYDQMTSEFGYRLLLNPFTGGQKDSNHTGIDLIGTHHARVTAIADGEIIEFYPPPNGYFHGDEVFGGKVVIKHNDGRYSMYAHMSITYNLSEHGSRRFVEAGQVLGRTGDTGYSFGEHLHFELWDENMNPIQPLFYLKDPENF